MNLEKYINDNLEQQESNFYYNESFCNLVFDYISSYVGDMKDFKQIDITYLNNKGYEVTDFYECE